MTEARLINYIKNNILSEYIKLYIEVYIIQTFKRKLLVYMITVHGRKVTERPNFCVIMEI